MSKEVKADMADVQDRAKEMKLEANIQGRDLKRKALNGAVDATGHKLTAGEKLDGAGMIVTDGMHSAVDRTHQQGLELGRHVRHAAVDLDKSDAKHSLDNAARKTGDALEDAKDSVVDAVSADTETIKSKSASGVDTTHIENAPAFDRSQAKKKKKAARAARDEERKAEKKRQALVDDTKAKATEIKASASQGAAKASSALNTAVDTTKVKAGELKEAASKGAVKAKSTLAGVRDKTGALIGNAALGLKERLDSYTETADEKTAHDLAALELEKKTLGQKTKAAISGAVDTVKEKYHEATTEVSEPHMEHKIAKSGVDISHIEGGENELVAARELKRLEAEELTLAEREKAALDAKLEAQADMTLGDKLGELGGSIARVAHKIGDSIATKYQELAHPSATKEAEEAKSSTVEEDGVLVDKPAQSAALKEKAETKTIDFDKDAKGEEEEEEEEEAPSAFESTKDSMIRHGLDAGVAARETASALAYKARIAAAEVDIAAKELAHRISEKIHGEKEKEQQQEEQKPDLLRAQALDKVTTSPQTPDNHLNQVVQTK